LLGKREFVRGGAGGSAVGMPPKDDEDVDEMGEESDDFFDSFAAQGDDEHEDEEDEEDEQDRVEDGAVRGFGGEEEAVPALEVSSLNEADRTAGVAGSALDTTDPETKRLRREAVEKSEVVLNRLTTLLQVAEKGMKDLEKLKHDAAAHERALSKVQRQSMALQLTSRAAAGGVPLPTLSEQIPPEERFFRAALPVEERGKEVQEKIFKFESRGWRRAETDKLRSELMKLLQSQLIRRVNQAHTLDTDAVDQKRKEIHGLSLSGLCDRVGDELLRDSTVWEEVALAIRGYEFPRSALECRLHFANVADPRTEKGEWNKEEELALWGNQDLFVAGKWDQARARVSSSECIACMCV
jgi:hypothetical protein